MILVSTVFLCTKYHSYSYDTEFSELFEKSIKIKSSDVENISKYMMTVIPSLYSRGGGSVNVFGCGFIFSDLLGINSSAIESRCMGLSKMPGTSF